MMLALGACNRDGPSGLLFGRTAACRLRGIRYRQDLIACRASTGLPATAIRHTQSFLTGFAGEFNWHDRVISSRVNVRQQLSKHHSHSRLFRPKVWTNCAVIAVVD